MSKLQTTVSLKNRSVKLQLYCTSENKTTIIVPDMLTFETEPENKVIKGWYHSDDLKLKVIALDSKTNEPLKGVKILTKSREESISADQWYELADIITREPNLVASIKQPYPEGNFSFQPTDTSKIEGIFKEGVADGFWILYEFYGLECTGYYSNGKKNGFWVFYDCGTPIATGNYINDKKAGIWFHFSTETKIVFE